MHSEVMNATSFINQLKDSNAWMRKSKALRYSAQAVVESSVKTLESVPVVDGKRCPDDAATDMLIDVHGNGIFLYSLSVECALKALIIKKSPHEIEVSATIDGSGELTSAELKKIGKHSNDLHNLVYLAELSGLLKPGDRPDRRDLLNYATEAIRWLGRYPVPKSSVDKSRPSGNLPIAAYGLHFSDFICEFLDEIDNAFDHD